MRTESLPAYLDCGKSQNSPSPMKHVRSTKKARGADQKADVRDDYSMDSDEISDEFIEIDCAEVD